jgi:hypothetical protein
MRTVPLCVVLLSTAVGCATSIQSSLPYEKTVERVRLMCKRLPDESEGEPAYPIANVREAPLYPGNQMAFTFTEPAAADTATRIHLQESGAAATITITCERDRGSRTVRDGKREGLWQKIVGHYVTNDPPGGPGLVDLIIRLRKAKPR